MLVIYYTRVIRECRHLHKVTTRSPPTPLQLYKHLKIEYS